MDDVTNAANGAPADPTPTRKERAAIYAAIAFLLREQAVNNPDTARECRLNLAAVEDEFGDELIPPAPVPAPASSAADAPAAAVVQPIRQSRRFKRRDS